MFGFIKNLIFGDQNTRTINKLKKTLEKINRIVLKDKTDIELREEHDKLKSGYYTKDQTLVHGFALIREVSKRTIGIFHYDVQILGALAIFYGNVAEMKTGEGKTFVTALPAYLAYLNKHTVHVITANEYLAQRDCQWLKPIFDFLNISCGFTIETMSYFEKIQNYRKDIVFTTAKNLGHDYLRDHLRRHEDPKLIKKLDYAIIDEIDYILIDESRTPLVISGYKQSNNSFFFDVHKFVTSLTEDDYLIDKKIEDIYLSENGIAKAESFFCPDSNLFDSKNAALLNGINMSLRANLIIQKDKDYIIQNNEILIVDHMSGRTIRGHSFSGGLQQFIQVKEGLQIDPETQNLASITFTNLFRLYEKLSGMSGTALLNQTEFKALFNLDVIVIPTHRPMIRLDLNDKVFGTKKEKYTAMINDIIAIHKTQQPILIGTINIEQSEYISHELKRHNISHELLNAKNPYKESEIIANAGKLGAVTVATNMAGRGTDIKLGGEEGTDEKKIKALGGLFVIGAERHESRRIDNQLIGRSGRQGDPGSSVFYLSCEDYIMRRYNYMKNLLADDKIEWAWLTNKVLSIQKEEEKNNYEDRKRLVEFDDIINSQRKIIYEHRENIIQISSFKNTYLDFVETFLDDLKLQFEESEMLIGAIYIKLEKLFNLKIEHNDSFEKIMEEITQHAQTHFNKLEVVNAELVNDYIKTFLIKLLDETWIEHLNNLEYLRRGIALRSYAQKDPIIEYKKESFALFQELMKNIQIETIKYISFIK